MTMITAVWTQRTGCNCEKCRTDDRKYFASFAAGDGEEIRTVDKATYSRACDMATAEDYRDGEYIGFNRPIEWDDVLPGRSIY